MTSSKPPLRSWLPAMLVLSLVWGCSFMFIEIGIRELHPTYVSLGRVAAGALALCLVLVVTRQRLPRTARMWGHLAVTGLVGAVVPFTLFAYGEQHVSSLLAGIWNGTTPLLVMLFAALLFGTEPFTAGRVTGLLFGFLGVLVVLGAWNGAGAASLVGQLMCLAAAACYGFVVPYQQKYVTSSGESGVALSAGMLLMATVELLVLAPLVAGPPPAVTALSPEVIGSVLALGALGTGIAFVLSMRNIRVVGGSTASMVTYLIPIVAVVAGVVVLNEHLAWYQPVGAVIILLGVAVSQGRFSRRRVAVAAEAPATQVATPLPAPTAR